MDFDIRSNASEVVRQLTDLQKRKLPQAYLNAADRTGRYVYAALRSEMSEVFDRPTPWTLGGLRYQQPTSSRPLVRIWLEESPGKGIPAAKFLSAEITGGNRAQKRFERALQIAGLMPSGSVAVPGRQAPLDAYGNVPASFIRRVLSDLQAAGEQNRKRTRRLRSNYFFVPPKGSHLKPAVYWHMPGGLLGVVFIFASAASYRSRYDFYGVGQRAYDRVATRFMTEALAQLP